MPSTLPTQTIANSVGRADTAPTFTNPDNTTTDSDTDSTEYSDVVYTDSDSPAIRKLYEILYEHEDISWTRKNYDTVIAIHTDNTGDWKYKLHWDRDNDEIQMWQEISKYAPNHDVATYNGDKVDVMQVLRDMEENAQ